MGLIAPLIGLVATLAPTIGPTVGGYLTEALSWHWLFFINIVPGIIVTIAALTLIDFDKPDYQLFEQFDWSASSPWRCFSARSNTCSRTGRATTGSRTTPSAARAGCRRCRRSSSSRACSPRGQPIVDLRAFVDRNFARRQHVLFRARHRPLRPHLSLSDLSRQIRGYNALMIGETMFVSGRRDVPERADRRPAGDAARPALHADRRASPSFALGNWQMSYITKDWDFWQLFVPQMLRGFGMMLAIVPITNISLGTLPPERAGPVRLAERRGQREAPLEILGKPRDWRAKRAKEMLDLVELGDFTRHMPYQLWVVRACRDRPGALVRPGSCSWTSRSARSTR